MSSVRDLAALAAGIVLAVGGVLAAVEANTADHAPAAAGAPTDIAVPPTDPATTTGAADPAGAGELPSEVAAVLDRAGGDLAPTLDAAALAEHVPPAVSELLTRRGAVLTVPPDTEITTP